MAILGIQVSRAAFLIISKIADNSPERGKMNVLL
jgi:hypothetical protein